MWKSESECHIVAGLRSAEVGDGSGGGRLALDGFARRGAAIESDNGKEKIENWKAVGVRVRGGAGREVPFSNFHFPISRECSGSDPGLSRCSRAAFARKQHRA